MLVTLFAVPAAVAVHEGAHALATLAVGGRVWRAQLGPVSFENTPTARHISWHWLSFAFWHVAVGSLADASALRLVIAAGPLGSLAIGGLALVAAVAASALALSLVAAAIGAASLVIGLSALNPFDSGSDGRRWWTLRPTHPQRQRTLALQQLGECALLGRPPADWPREMVRAAAEGEQDGDDAVAGRLFAYVAAMADDAVDEAGRMLSDLRVPTASPYASVVAIEAAYWNAVAGHDRRPLELALESGAALPPRFAVACAAVGRPDDCAMSDAIAWWMPFAIPLAAFATIPVHEALHYVGFRLAGGDLMALRMALRLAVVNVQLDTVRVVAGRKIPYLVEGIERRWRSGLGRILDGNTVRERSSTFVSDALRGLPGVSVRQLGGWGQEVLLRSTNGGECRAVVFVDGMYTPMGGSGGFTIDDFVPRDNVAAIEVFARPVFIPAEYVNLSSGCGELAIWTRYATENVRILPPKSERR